MVGDPKLIAQYRLTHETSTYGNTSVRNLGFLRPEIKLLRPRSIIDCGCGQSRLLEALHLGSDVELVRYDPAIPAYSTKPDEVFDLILNIDVLEHIEESDLDEFIAELRTMARNAILIVDTKPASKLLPDGRNAHATIRPHEWWRERLSRHFPILVPIATARRSRAGFRTWLRKPGDERRYVALRLGEVVHQVASRLTGTTSA